MADLSANAAAWAQAHEAARQSDIAIFSLILMAAIGAAGVIANFLIAGLAVAGPLRERWTRDLELRIGRVRINRRAGYGCGDGLKSMEYFERWHERQAAEGVARRIDVAQYRRRFSRNDAVIQHYLGLGLRDKKIIQIAIEVRVLLRDLDLEFHHGLEAHPGAEDETVVLAKLAPIMATLAARKKRRQVLREKLSDYTKAMKLKEASLQQEMDSVWTWGWLIPSRRKVFMRTSRD